MKLAALQATNHKFNKFRNDPVQRDGNLFISILKGLMRFVTDWLGKRKLEFVAINLSAARLGMRRTAFVVPVK